MLRAQLNQPVMHCQYFSLKLPDEDLGGFAVQRLSSSMRHSLAGVGSVRDMQFGLTSIPIITSGHPKTCLCGLCGMPSLSHRSNSLV